MSLQRRLQRSAERRGVVWRSAQDVLWALEAVERKEALDRSLSQIRSRSRISSVHVQTPIVKRDLAAEYLEFARIDTHFYRYFVE